MNLLQDMRGAIAFKQSHLGSGMLTLTSWDLP